MRILLDSDENPSVFQENFFLSLIKEIRLHVDFLMDAELSIVLTDNASIQELNRVHRGINSPTDVLAFPMFEEMMLGDIVISIEAAGAQAAEASITLSREVAFLFIHGFLHLLGYDHDDGHGGESEGADEMYALQEEILRGWEKKVGSVGK